MAEIGHVFQPGVSIGNTNLLIGSRPGVPLALSPVPSMKATREMLKKMPGKLSLSPQPVTGTTTIRVSPHGRKPVFSPIIKPSTSYQTVASSATHISGLSNTRPKYPPGMGFSGASTPGSTRVGHTVGHGPKSNIYNGNQNHNTSSHTGVPPIKNFAQSVETRNFGRPHHQKLNQKYYECNSSRSESARSVKQNSAPFNSTSPRFNNFDISKKFNHKKIKSVESSDENLHSQMHSLNHSLNNSQQILFNVNSDLEKFSQTASETAESNIVYPQSAAESIGPGSNIISSIQPNYTSSHCHLQPLSPHS